MNTFNFHIKQILVPTDFSETANLALEHAIYMAKLYKAYIVLTHNTGSNIEEVTPESHYASSISNLKQHEKEIYAAADAHLHKLAKKIQVENHIEVAAITTSGWIDSQILKTANSVNSDIIVMGTHGARGMRELLIGSTAFRVVNDARCPVLTVRNHTQAPGFKNILLPFSDQPHSREKVNYALKFAEMYGSTIHVLGVDMEESPAHLHKIELEAKQIKQIIEKHGVPCSIQVQSSGYVGDNILEYAEKVHADLIIVMSNVDKNSISEYLMGPFSQQVVNHSPIPVLSIHPSFNTDTVNLRGYGW
jgi:nucleotide-binding universal stress UspA family protein